MQRFPQDLIDAFNSYEVVGIIGSGPSVAAGFPNWSQLLGLMVTECEQQLVGFKQGKELRNLIKNGHLLEVADECSRLLEGQLYRDFIQRVFRQKLIRPVRLHELIVQLPFSSLLTTNYDNLLERACVARPRSDMYPLVFTLKNAAQLPRLASERRFFIFKIHGDADDVESIVLTKRDYREIIHNNEVYRTALSQILATHTALFVGYGLRDHDLNLILGEQAALFKAYGRRHYAFLADPGTILPKSFLEHYNVTVIPYTRKKYHGELERLLETLLKHVKTAPVADEKDETRKLKQLIEIEREFCKKLGTFIEPERARFLKLHAPESLEPRDRQLVEESIQHWDSREMAHRDLEFQLRQSQRMEAIGLLSAGIAHDFNNILTVIRGYAMLLLQKGRLTAELEDHVRQIDSATEQAVNLVRQLLTFARKQVTYRVPMNLNEIVERLLRILRRTIGENISLKMDLHHDLTLVEADASMIEQVIMNLAVNARDAMPKGGELIIQTKTSIITDEN